MREDLGGDAFEPLQWRQALAGLYGMAPEAFDDSPEPIIHRAGTGAGVPGAPSPEPTPPDTVIVYDMAYGRPGSSPEPTTVAPTVIISVADAARSPEPPAPAVSIAGAAVSPEPSPPSSEISVAGLAGESP
jgi:hypothetical protein